MDKQIRDITDIKNALDEKFKEMYGEKMKEIEIENAVKYTAFGYWAVTIKLKIDDLSRKYSVDIDESTGDVTRLYETR